MLILTMFKS